MDIQDISTSTPAPSATIGTSATGPAAPSANPAGEPALRPFAEAYPLARTVQALLEPVCEPEHCVIVGSLRRHASAITHAGTASLAEKHHAALVKDMELLVYPKPGHDLFGGDSYENAPLYAMLNKLLDDGVFTMHPEKKDGSRYKKLVFEGLTVDLFICLPPAQWGYQMAIRTGPWQYSKWLVTARKWGGGLPSNLEIKDAGLYLRGKLHPTPTEASFFKALGLLMPEPHERTEP